MAGRRVLDNSLAARRAGVSTRHVRLGPGAPGRSTGGDFELSGTIGQPDAGVLSSGEFELCGGFWFPLSLADCNSDGRVNLMDYEDFEPCFTGPDAGVRTGCGCFDVDRSHAGNLGDFAVAQTTFTWP